MKEEKEFEKIEEYFLGNMNAKDEAFFNRQLKEDGKLADEVEHMKKVLTGLKGVGISNQLDQIHFEEKKRERHNQLRWVISVAASLIIITSFWWLSLSSVSNEDLFESYFSRYPDVVSVRGNINLNLAKGMEEYSSGRYDTAKKYFNSVSSNSNQKQDAIFYLAMSHLILKETNQAIEYLEELSIQKTQYQPQVNWYLALAYLRKNDNNKAISCFKMIEKDAFKSAEAQKLLNELL